jgi:lysophospholipase L1-like esterase
MHLVLLGDSIFDNKAYVGGAPDVVEQLRKILPAGDRATLLARDGDRTHDVARQLQSLPPDATHLVISVGGNDALDQSALLSESARSFAEVLQRLAALGESFGDACREMLQQASSRQLPLAVCTIYDPNYGDAALQRIIVAALCHFNDCILREAFAQGIPIIDLRFVCDERSDFANDIEPSSTGAAKIARAILNLTTQHDFATRRSAIFI